MQDSAAAQTLPPVYGARLDRQSIHATVFTDVDAYARRDLADLLYPRTALCLHSLHLPRRVVYFREFLGCIAKKYKENYGSLAIGDSNENLLARPMYAFVDFQSVRNGLRVPDLTFVCGKTDPALCPFARSELAQVDVCCDYLVYTRNSRLVFDTKINPFLETTTCLVKRLVKTQDDTTASVHAFLLIDVRF